MKDTQNYSEMSLMEMLEEMQRLGKEISRILQEPIEDKKRGK